MSNDQPVQRALVRRIVDDLSRNRDRNDLIMMVCDQTGKNWPEAEQFVKQVEAEQAHAIAGKQSPLIILLSTALVAAGMGLLYGSFRSIEGALHEDLLGVVIILAGSYPYGFAILGLGMLAGGMIGLYRHLLHYFAT